MKDFDIWNKLKKYTESKRKRIFFKERDVFYLKMGKNIGREQNGKGSSFARPVMVLKKINNDSFRGIPFSTKVKNTRFHYSLNYNNRDQVLLLSQLRLFDAKRLIKKNGKVSQLDFVNVTKKIVRLLA